jgi:elongation factor Ts
MNITAQMVNALREKTGVGMMQCKKALTETNGDVDAAVDLLRKQGAAVAAKRADKAANEGAIVLANENGKAVMAELNCETDFVAKSDDFASLSADILKVLLATDTEEIDTVLAAKVGALDIAGRINETMAKIGEKISIRRISTMKYGAGEACFAYNHLGGKAGALVKLSFEGTPSDVEALNALAKDVAMQIVAFEAVAVDADGVPADIVQKERDIARDQIVNEGKTKAEFVDRQVEGRVNKFLQGICLNAQGFLRDTKVTVKDHLSAEASKLGLSNLKVAQFVRFELGK